MNYELSVVQWAAEKGIFDKATPKDQALKFIEEAGEVIACINKGYDETLKLEIGDVLVTLIILSRMKGYSTDECLKAAYEKISKRKGEMVDGVFVKEND